MAEALWYYEDGGRPAGPVSEAALSEAIRQGRLARGQRVWTAGQEGWLAWESLPALAALAPPPAPPGLPPAAAPPASPAWGAPASREPASGWSPPPAGPGASGPLRLYPRAPLGARFLAALVDGLIGSGPVALAALLFGFGSVAGMGNGSVSALGAVVVLATALWALYYGFTKDARPGGQSIGKRMMHLMVIHLPTSRPCNLQQSALRALVQLVLQLVPYVGWLVEPIAVLVAAGGRRLGDQAAGTQVILAADFRAPR